MSPTPGQSSLRGSPIYILHFNVVHRTPGAAAPSWLYTDLSYPRCSLSNHYLNARVFAVCYTAHSSTDYLIIQYNSNPDHSGLVICNCIDNSCGCLRGSLPLKRHGSIDPNRSHRRRTHHRHSRPSYVQHIQQRSSMSWVLVTLLT